MFNWFFKKPSFTEQHTTFISTTTWIAEINEPIQKDAIHCIFSQIFDFEHFGVCKNGNSMIAVLPTTLNYAKITFGETKKSKVVIVLFNENNLIDPPKHELEYTVDDLNEDRFEDGLTVAPLL